MSVKHIVPGLDDPTCGIAVAAKQLMARGVGENGEVWVHSMWSPMVIKASLGALLTGKKLVRMPHGCTDPEKLRFHWHKKRWVAPIERWLFRRADRIVATCEDEVEWIKKFEPRVKRVEIIRLDGHAERVGKVEFPDSHKERKDRKGGELRLLYVGRLHPLKGVEYLLEAMPNDCNLVVIGKDEGEGGKLKQIAARRGLDVEFRGIVSEEAKEAAYQWCDVLVLPTLSENFGLVVAEALERGKRVITTDGAPAWGGDLELPVSSLEEGLDGQSPSIRTGYGGRLLYLVGYRDGSRNERVRLLKEAIEKLVSSFQFRV